MLLQRKKCKITKNDFRYTEQCMIDKINELKWPKACIDNWVIKIWDKTIGTIWEKETLHNLQRETMIFISWITGEYERKQREKWDNDPNFYKLDPPWINNLKDLLRGYPYN